MLSPPSSQPEILLIDDDSTILTVNEQCLQAEGYTVYLAEDAHTALEALRDHNIDLIVLDVLLREQSGFSLVQNIRMYSDAPILFLSALDRVEDRVMGLSIGDDYLCKPYSLRELCARIRLLLRRSSREATLISLPPLYMNVIGGQVTLDGHAIDLTDTEFKILYLLAKAPNITVTFQTLHEEIWRQPYRNAQNLMVHISSIRKKLCIPLRQYHFVQSIRGQGYMLAYPPRITTHEGTLL